MPPSTTPDSKAAVLYTTHTPGSRTLLDYHNTQGQLHRDNGPAHTGIHAHGEENHLVLVWRHNGKPRRLDGPAYAVSGGAILWTLSNKNSVATKAQQQDT